MSEMRNPLQRAKGLGSSKSGLPHWRAQRITAVTLLLLIPWLIWSLLQLTGAGYPQAAAFIADPINATLLILVLLCMLYHAMLGLQVVIEDYVHHHGLSLLLLFAIRIAAAAGMIAGVVHILKLVLGA
ncbi:MAG: succinate dehydrogenase, hydrophobic membrane anchor protein [Xanthomonadales bacterium]|nr:succinate dehydrogenase, hydrophobic membrane anchor protein [Xanthomonadales bacterium]